MARPDDPRRARSTAPLAERLTAIAADAGITPEVPPAVTAEVQAWLAAPGIDDPALIDRTAIPFVTIDGPGTRDLDQAIHVEATADGFRLRYAIADASYYVAPGTALFDDAVRRGASFYIPGRSIPMLPAALSQGLISLGPGVDRRALIFGVAFDRAGTITGFALERARIHSRAQLTFGGVQAFVDDGAAAEVEYGASLRALAVLGDLRIHHADRAAMVRYRRVETSVRLDADGALVIDRGDRSMIELANEQISILCNALGARYLLEGAADLVQPIYRVHEPPADERVAGYERLVSAVAAQRGLPDDPWLYRKAAALGLAGYLEALPTTGPEGRIARALHRQAMLLNGRSRFDATPTPHFGVGEQVYSRFTAPMREIVGVQCHAQAIDRLLGSSPRTPAEDLATRARVIEAGNRSKELQRALDREVDAAVVAAVFAEDGTRDAADRTRRMATVVGITSSKVHLVLDEPPIDTRALFVDQGAHEGGAWLVVADEGATLRRANVDGPAGIVCRLGDAVIVRAVGPDAVVILEIAAA
jgi:ribonuclease R